MRRYFGYKNKCPKVTIINQYGNNNSIGDLMISSVYSLKTATTAKNFVIMCHQINSIRLVQINVMIFIAWAMYSPEKMIYQLCLKAKKRLTSQMRNTETSA